MDVAGASTDETSTVDAAWAEMNLHLSRSKGLCLVFLCSDSPAALAQMRQRLEDTWVWRTAPLVFIRPESADAAAKEVLRALQDYSKDKPHLRAPVWVELHQVDVAEGNEWDRTRAEVMSRLNEWRSWLQAEFRRPLVFALPQAWRRKMAEVAPDLWSVRTYSAAVETPAEETR